LVARKTGWLTSSLCFLHVQCEYVTELEFIIAEEVNDTLEIFRALKK
jgi:hypothetical protein